MDEILQRDQNHITVLGGVTDDANEYVRMLRVDPVTGRVLVSVTGIPGGGDVTGASSSTDNAITRFDGTSGKIIQNSTVIVGDTGAVTVTNTGTTSALTVNNNNILSTTYGVTLNENSTIGGLKIIQNTVTDNTSSDNGALVIDNSGNTGYALDAYTSQLSPNRFARFYVKPAFTTTLNGAQSINSTSTSIIVNSTSGFPTSGTLIILNNASTTESAQSAYIHYTSITSTTFVGTAGAFYKPVATMNLVGGAKVNYDNTTTTYTLLNLLDSGSNGGAVNLKLTGPNPDLEFLSQGGYDGTIGEGKFEIDIPTGDNLIPNSSDVFRLNGRLDTNNGFQPIVSMTRPGLNQGMFGIGFQNKISPITLSAHLHVYNDAVIDTNASALVVSIFQGATSQTADLMQFKNVGGTILASVTSAGIISSAVGTATGNVTTIDGIQSLTNKDLSSGTNTYPSNLITLNGSQTLTNKSLTSVAITGAGAGVATLVYSNSASNGTITIPGTTGSTMVLTTSTQTLSNKRVTRRFVATTQSATPTINTDNTDISSITALAQAITSMTTNLSGTPVAGDYLQIQITDNGTARAITWGASFASTTVTLPTTTVISTLLRIGFQWDTVAAVWQCIAVC